MEYKKTYKRTAMKYTKLTRSLLLALSLTMVTNSTNCMEPKKQGQWTWLSDLPTKPSKLSQLLTEHRWIPMIAHILLGVGNMEQLWHGMEGFEFTQLPNDVQNQIIGLLMMGENCKTMVEAASIINSLAQVNKQLNELVNDYEFSVQLVKYLADKFNSTEEEVCLALHTQAAMDYLNQFKLLDDIVDHKINHLTQETIQQLYAIDLNFRLHSIGEHFENGLFFPSVAGGGTILMYAYHFNIPELQNALLNAPNITINLPNKEGRTALMVAVDGYQFIMNINGSPIHPVTLQHPAITFLTNYPHVNINQQDAQGNTALLIALETKKIIKAKQQIIRDIAKFVITERPATPQEDLIQALLDAGADPELANNEGLTPLQAALDSGNQNIIQLIQDAITRKHNQQ
jgi:hypothetical protein